MGEDNVYRVGFFWLAKDQLCACTGGREKNGWDGISVVSDFYVFQKRVQGASEMVTGYNMEVQIGAGSNFLGQPKKNGPLTPSPIFILY